MSDLNIISDWTICGISLLKHRPGARSKIWKHTSPTVGDCGDHWSRWTVCARCRLERFLRHFERKLMYGMSLGSLKVILFTFATWKQLRHSNKAVVLYQEWSVRLYFYFPLCRLRYAWYLVVETRSTAQHLTMHRIEPTTKNSPSPSVGSKSKTCEKRCCQMLSNLGKLYLLLSILKVLKRRWIEIR